MDDFKTILRDGTTSFHVTFHKIRIPNGWKFYITLIHDGDIHTSFDMTKNGESWKVVPPVPNWIREKENELAEIINRNM